MFSLWMRSRPAIPQDPLAITCIRDGRPRGGGKERYLHTWGENLRFYHGVLPLLQAFEQVGIDAVVLKGLALIARFYRDPGLQPMADVDVLVSSRGAGTRTEPRPATPALLVMESVVNTIRPTASASDSARLRHGDGAHGRSHRRRRRLMLPTL